MIASRLVSASIRSMILRWILGILISGAWLVSMGLLLRMHYFPDESKLSEAEPAWVLERFLAYGNESALDIWKGNEIVGLLRMETRPAFPVEKPLGSDYRLTTRAEMEIELPSLGKREIELDMASDMTKEGDVVQSKLELRLISMNLVLEVKQKGDAEPEVAVKDQNNNVLMDLNALKTNQMDASSGIMKLVAGSFGIRTLDFPSSGKQVAEKTTHKARRGAFNILDTTYRGYILKTKLGGGEREFTLHLGESGEVLQMKTSFLDYRFINTELRPEGVPVHKKNKSKATN